MNARVRIGKVKLKSGGEVRLLPSATDQPRMEAMQSIREVLDAQGAELGGYAIVAWGMDKGSSCHWFVADASQIPTPMIPEYVKARLMLGIAVHWTLDSLE